MQLFALHRCLNSRSDLIGDVNVLEDQAKLLRDLFFPKPRQETFASIAAATVVDIFAFLQFSGDRAAIVGTGKQATKCNLMFAIFAFVASPNDILDSPEKSRGNQSLVSAAVAFSGPLEDSDVDGIREDFVKIAASNHLPESVANRLP